MTTARQPVLTQEAPRDTLEGHYTGEGGPLFRLATVNSVLTLITLGIYRFWARTRVRRYIWSSTTAGGDSFQYTGSGLEKLLGFLVAVVILAFSLGALQLGLYFLNLSLFSPRGAEEDFRSGGMAILFEEVMFLYPYVIHADPVGQFHLFQGFLKKPGFIPFPPGAR